MALLALKSSAMALRRGSITRKQARRHFEPWPPAWARAWGGGEQATLDTRNTVFSLPAGEFRAK